MNCCRILEAAALTLALAAAVAAQGPYDLLLKGGHVIDPKNEVSGRSRCGLQSGRVAVVAEAIDPAQALKVIDVAGLYVAPGIIDIHVHAYAGTGERHS